MVFAQPRPIMLAERQPVAPSLLSDPAFSTDPHAHPCYVVTSHEPWLSSPPTGHPTLKSKSRRRPPADDVASDSEPFHLIPPPNSPVNFPEGPRNPTAFAVPDDVLDTGAPPEPHSRYLPSPTTAAEPVSGQSHQEPYRSPTPPPPPTAHPPAPPKRRITLMTLLKRRSSHQPQSSASANPKLRKASTLSKPVPNRSDVTLPSLSPHETNPNIERQGFPPRPSALGTSTPATVLMPSNGQPALIRRPTDIPTNRQENLDRIDELDETNPWGVSLHHGGPYEAAVQAIRGKDKMVIPGHGSYNRGVPQSQDNNYFPPQATGLSLNLSPGQVLPRNYHPHHNPPSQPVQKSKPPPPTAVMMRPPAKKPHPQSQTPKLVPPVQSSATLPVSSRRQSYQASPILMTPRDVQLRRQSLNPTPATSQVNFHTLSPLSSSSYIPPQQQRPTFAPVTNRQVSPNSRPAETQLDQVTENPINLVSIGIGMVMLDDEDEDEDESSSSQPSTTPDGGRLKGLPLSNTPFPPKTPPEHTQPEISRTVTSSQENMSSPDSLATQPRKASLEEMFGLPEESPPPYSSPTKEVQPKEFGRFQDVPSQPSSASSIHGSGSSFAHSEVAHWYANPATMQAPSSAPSVLNQPTFRTDAPRSYLPSRNSPERAGFEDNHSVHPSVSSKSSSSRSSGPPSSRRVPRRLVMPAPLAQSSAIPPRYQNRPPLAQLPPQRPTRHIPHSPLSSEPMPSTQIFVKAQAQEIHLAPSRAGKLKKSLSLIGPASHHPPVVTAVSFAPPIIGFTQEDEFQNKLAHKRLSKRKPNW